MEQKKQSETQIESNGLVIEVLTPSKQVAGLAALGAMLLRNMCAGATKGYWIKSGE